MKEKLRCIYNPKLAGYLIFNGVHLKRFDKNFERPWTHVYMFEDNGNIDELIKTFKKLKSKENDKDGINNRRSSSNDTSKNT